MKETVFFDNFYVENEDFFTKGLVKTMDKDVKNFVGEVKNGPSTLTTL